MVPVPHVLVVYIHANCQLNTCLRHPHLLPQKVIQTEEQGTVKFELSDLPICGGMLHVIDQVLLPCKLDLEELGSAVADGNSLENKIEENKKGKGKSSKKEDEGGW